MIHIGRLATAFLLSLVLAVPQDAVAEDPRPSGSRVRATLDEHPMRSAIEWRESFGLRADPSYVERSLADPAAFPNLDWGVPLSRTEVQDLKRRLRVQDRFVRFIPTGLPGYAGAYIDQRRGGLPVVLFSEVTDALLDRLRQRLPDIDVEVHEAAVPRVEPSEPKLRSSSSSDDEAAIRDAATAATSPFRSLWGPTDPEDVDLRYYCDGPAFTLTDLASAYPAAEAEATLGAAIDHHGARRSDDGLDWHVIEVGDGRIMAMAMARDQLSWLELARAMTDVYAAETWDFVRGGHCRPMTAIGRGFGGEWWLDPDHPAPGPDARTLHVIGDAGCNGTERRGRAHATYTRDALLIAIPMGSKVHSDMCHGIGPRRMTIRLPKPLGERELYDSGSLPIRRVVGEHRLRLPALPIEFGSDFGPGWSADDGGGVGWRDPGTWSISDPRTDRAGRLRFRVSVAPPRQEVPLEPGPAVLSVGMWYLGGLGGDVGFGRLEQMRHIDAGTCTGPACTYEVDVVLDARLIARAIEALPQVDLASVAIGLRLVRTYGQGEWLQVLDLLIPEVPNIGPVRHGTLRQPVETSGEIVSGGIIRTADARSVRAGRRPAFDLASVVEATRTRQGDDSAVTPSVSVELKVDAPGCRMWSPVWITDEWGTTGFQGSLGAMDPSGPVVRLPVDGTWRVAIGSPFPEPRHENAASAGTFETAASDLRVRATFECREPGSIAAPGFMVERTDALPEMSTVGGWSRVRQSSSGRTRGPRSFVLGELDGHVLSFESRPMGWLLQRSDGGWRWRTRPHTTQGLSLPALGSADHARLVSTDDRRVLAMVVDDGSGRPRLVSWSSRGGRRWRSAPRPSPVRLAEPVSDLQLAAAEDVVLALTTSPDGSRLLSSRDGRTWRATDDSSVVAIGDGTDRILGVIEHEDRPTLGATRDGREWHPLWEVPAGLKGPYRIVETDAGVLLAGQRDDLGVSVWLHEPAGSDWREVMGTLTQARIDDVSADGDDVVMSGQVSEAGERGSRSVWLAASHDGGRSWRQWMSDDVAGPCRMRALASDEALVAATADCDDQPTVWRAEPGD